MKLRMGIVLALALGLFVGCGGQRPALEGVKDEKSPEYGESVAEKLKRDLAADPETAKAQKGQAGKKAKK